MRQYDLAEPLLAMYRSRAQPPSDLAGFWEGTLDAGRRVRGPAQLRAVDIGLSIVTTNVGAVMADVPFLSDFRRGAEIAGAPPYTELSTYLATHPDQVSRAFRTLAYFDVSVLSCTARAPALFSVGLMDDVCPPSTVYAAYNAYAGPKGIRSYPFNGHEGGHACHQAEQLRWLSARMPATASRRQERPASTAR
jgi:cephalosporin-C deacetylase